MSSFAKREPPSGPSYPSMPEAPTRNWPNFQPGERTLGKGDPAASPANAGTHQIADRKSTRLNSSHGYISYAVFCLKKKKNSQPLNSLNLHDRLVDGAYICAGTAQV